MRLFRFESEGCDEEDPHLDGAVGTAGPEEFEDLEGCMEGDPGEVMDESDEEEPLYDDIDWKRCFASGASFLYKIYIYIYIYIHIYTFVVLLGNQYRFSPLATKPIKKVLFPIVSGKSGSLMVFLIQYPGTAMVKMHWNMWHLPYNLQQELNIKNPSIYIYIC